MVLFIRSSSVGLMYLSQILLFKTGFDRNRAYFAFNYIYNNNELNFLFSIFRAQGDVYRLQSKLETSQSEADRLAMDLVTIQLILFNL